EFKNYSIYYSKDQNPANASEIKNNYKENYFAVKDKGFYWVMAKQELTKISEFYGKDIPVAVDKYSQILPISDVIQVN
ncbi:MAG: hypothetical protein RIR48_2120, partial [Bacteroidota bacterium]